MQDNPGRSKAYLQGWSQLDREIREGGAFSGYERNCAFLNVGGQFAPIAATTGLDLTDDGRAVLATDWDQDGDVDLWLINRSGPQVRVMRNDLPGPRHGGPHFVALRLRGDPHAASPVNLDAIGARVDLQLADSPTHLVRGLRTSDGFLSQHSKWLSVGLGHAGQPAPQVATVRVRWPGGRTETFAGVTADARFDLVQGEGKARPRTPTEAAPPLPTERIPLTTEPPGGRVALSLRVPMPGLPYHRLDGTQDAFRTTPGRPALVSLWASYCKPCLAEMRELVRQTTAVHAAGLDVVALSVDELNDASAAEVPAAARPAALAIAQLHWPFVAGVADVATADKLHLLQAELFQLDREFSLPISFLVDGDGQVVALWRGPVDTAQLLADVKQLRAHPGQVLPQVAAFPGRWLQPPVPPDVLGHLASALAEHGYPADAVAIGREAVRRDPHSAEAFNMLGATLDRTGDAAGATEALQRAVALAPDSPLYHANLGNRWIAEKQFAKAIAEFQIGVRLQPQQANAHNNLGFALALAGQPAEALVALDRALKLDPSLATAHYNRGQALRSLHRDADATTDFAQAVRLDDQHWDARLALVKALLDTHRPAEALVLAQSMAAEQPEDFTAQWQLGVALGAAGQCSSAIGPVRKAHDMRPVDTRVTHKLAWLLATCADDRVRDGAEAVRLAREVVERTKAKVPEPLDTLAAALAETGHHAQAIETCERAIAMAEAAGKPELVATFRAHLEHYRHGQPMRTPVQTP
jgi:Flp pilus assembly protein TadD/thiol-disulfide isomerase/thioredoxin